MSITPEQTRLARTFDDDRYAWARTRRLRRRAVVAEIALFLVLIAATVVSATTDEGWTTTFFVVWTVGLLGFVPLHSVLNLGIRGVLDRSAGSLDEHQLELRDRSFVAMSWPATALQFAAWAGAVTLVAASGHVVLGFCLGFLLWLAAGLLTYWHLAWTAPDEAADADLDR